MLGVVDDGQWLSVQDRRDEAGLLDGELPCKAKPPDLDVGLHRRNAHGLAEVRVRFFSSNFEFESFLRLLARQSSSLRFCDLGSRVHASEL